MEERLPNEHANASAVNASLPRYSRPRDEKVSWLRYQPICGLCVCIDPVRGIRILSPNGMVPISLGLSRAVLV